MDKSHQQRAIDKTKIEITKNIGQLIAISKVCGLGELLYYMHALHCIRLLIPYGEVPEEKKEEIGIYQKHLNDSYKYLIQMLYKYSGKGLIQNKLNNLLINAEVVEVLTKGTLSINSKYEALTFFTLFNDIEVSGERDENVRVNLQSVVKDESRVEYLYYGVRVNKENDFQKDKTKTKNAFLNYFREEYIDYADLFQKEFDIDLENFISLIDFILDGIIERMGKNKDQYIYHPDGKVDVHAYQTIIRLASSFFIEKKALIDKFGKSIEKIIKRLIFKASKFNEHQLQYNLIARQPLLDFGDVLLISPELLLDSLFTNSHYSLLESGNSKEEYKMRYSKKFLNDIVKIANRFGYVEIKRELELFENNNQLGDIDLVLKNSSNHFLLIEAKNHALPMEVFFHDQKATEKRLEYLNREWEQKVFRRSEHLAKNSEAYGITGAFTYIIVSRFPEILSHFSQYLVLTLNELEYWLKQNDQSLTFSSIYDGIYEDANPPSAEKLLEMQKELATGWRFEK